MAIALVALALPGIAACQQAAQVAQKSEDPVPEPKPAAPVSFERETKSYTFNYSYPAEAAAIPKLAAMLDAERAEALAELEKQAAEAAKDAADNDYPFNPHMLDIGWTVTGDNAAMLAMVSQIGSFSGGAHGNTGFEALLWDKAKAGRIKLDSVFTDAAAALEPMRQPYCDALNAERRDRRGEDMSTDPEDMFNVCPPVSDLVLVPYAGSDREFDRIMFIAGPYVAGPYAEGVYEVSVALPAGALERIKPEYRSAFITAAR